MGDKTQCEPEREKQIDGKELSLVLKKRGRPYRSHPKGIKEDRAHREAQRKYLAKLEVKDNQKAKQKGHRLRVSKIVFVCVFVCDFECRGKKHREHSQCLLLQKRKNR